MSPNDRQTDRFYDVDSNSNILFLIILFWRRRRGRWRGRASARQVPSASAASPRPNASKICCAATGCEMSRLRAIARSLRVPQSQNARCTLMTVGVWVGGSIVTIVLAAKPLYCSLGLVCDPLVQKLVFRALLGLWMRVLRSLCFLGRNRPRAKEGVTRTKVS